VNRVSGAMEVVNQMIAAWKKLDAAAICACFAVDAVWCNVSYDPVVGRANISAAIYLFLGGVAEGEFQVHYAGEVSPGVVLTERTDIFRMKDGRMLRIPVMGAFEVRGGLISSWRDYFDPAVMKG
jgi:limonene-1,2-epoxide hydrolase